jgi:hypothetical protein
MWPDWVIAFVGDGRIALLALAVIGLEALVIVVFMRSRARVGSLILTMAYAHLPGQSLAGHPCYHSGGAEIAGNWPPAWVAYLAGSLKARASTISTSSTR